MWVGIWRGIVAFITTSVLSGVCIAMGVIPGEVFAAFLASPPAWISDPLTRILAMLIGGFFGFLCWKIGTRIWEQIRTDPRQPVTTSVQTAASLSQTSERDVWLLEAIFRGAWGKWIDPPIIDPHGTGYTQQQIESLDKVVHEAIPQFIVDERLPVWGKHANVGLWKPVPTNFWDHNRIDWFSVLRGSANGLKTAPNNSSFNTGVWTQLMTNRERVDELWPVTEPRPRKEFSFSWYHWVPPLAMVVGLFLFVGIYHYRIQTACDPDFNWVSKAKTIEHPTLKRPVVIRKGRVNPLSREPFFMTIEAHGKGVDALYIFHQTNKKDPDPRMRQLTPSGIEARALNPFSIIEVVAFVTLPHEATLGEPNFYCAD